MKIKCANLIQIIHADQNQSAKIGVGWTSWAGALITEVVVVISVTNHLSSGNRQMSMSVDFLVMQRILEKAMSQINEKIVGNLGQRGSFGKVQRTISVSCVFQEQTKHVQAKWSKIMMKNIQKHEEL